MLYDVDCVFRIRIRIYILLAEYDSGVNASQSCNYGHVELFARECGCEALECSGAALRDAEH